MNDPISDILTRIRNAVRAGHQRMEVPLSRVKLAIANLLKSEGYIGNVAVVEKGRFKVIRIMLRYDSEGKAFITGLDRVSRPGRRVYTGHRDIPKVMGGLGVNIISTPRGLLSGRDARKARLGGEIVCNIW